MAAQAPTAAQASINIVNGRMSWRLPEHRRNPTPLESRAADVLAAELEDAYGAEPNSHTQVPQYQEWRARWVARVHAYATNFVAPLNLPFLRPLMSDLLFHYIRTYNEKQDLLGPPVQRIRYPENEPDDHRFPIEVTNPPPRHDEWYTQWWTPAALVGMHFLFGYMYSPFI